MNFKLAGFADEASENIDIQIQALNEVGYQGIELRNVNGVNIDSLSEFEMKHIAEALNESDLEVIGLGSTIGNWNTDINEDFSTSLEKVERIIAFSKLIDTHIVRIMSYKVIDDLKGCPLPGQEEQKRFKRLREISSRLRDAGLIAAHENCYNYGGLGYQYTENLLENVPGLKLIFDTANTVGSTNYIDGVRSGYQDSIEFLERFYDHIIHIHIKDASIDKSNIVRYEYAGKGAAKISETLNLLRSRNYEGWLSIEPHIASVYHDLDEKTVDSDYLYKKFIDYALHFKKEVYQHVV